MEHGIKAGKNSPKAKSDIYCPDTYLVVSDLRKDRTRTRDDCSFILLCVPH